MTKSDRRIAAARPRRNQIGPDQAKALAFLTGGKLAFAARVNLPAIYCQTTEDAAHP
ncbi:MAG: hypothetical protein WAM75_06985 [Xanthobacteraceae bacterium]